MEFWSCPSTSAGVFRPCLGDKFSTSAGVFRPCLWDIPARRIPLQRVGRVGGRLVGIAMAWVPPAEQWCVCAPVWQPHHRCQDRETLQTTVYMRKFGCVCRLGYLEKRRARYAKQIEEQERQVAEWC